MELTRCGFTEGRCCVQDCCTVVQSTDDHNLQISFVACNIYHRSVCMEGRFITYVYCGQRATESRNASGTRYHHQASQALMAVYRAHLRLSSRRAITGKTRNDCRLSSLTEPFRQLTSTNTIQIDGKQPSHCSRRCRWPLLWASPSLQSALLCGLGEQDEMSDRYALSPCRRLQVLISVDISALRNSLIHRLMI